MEQPSTDHADAAAMRRLALLTAGLTLQDMCLPGTAIVQRALTALAQQCMGVAWFRPPTASHEVVCAIAPTFTDPPRRRRHRRNRARR